MIFKKAQAILRYGLIHRWIALCKQCKWKCAQISTKNKFVYLIHFWNLHPPHCFFSSQCTREWWLELTSRGSLSLRHPSKECPARVAGESSVVPPYCPAPCHVADRTVSGWGVHFSARILYILVQIRIFFNLKHIEFHFVDRVVYSTHSTSMPYNSQRVQ